MIRPRAAVPFLWGVGRAAAALVLLCHGVAKAQDTAPGPIGTPGTRLAFISDTQAPIWIETLVLKETGNRQATGKLFEDIRRLHPRHVFILGDLVALGWYAREWEDIDRYVDLLRADSVPVDAILGNHEVMHFANIGEKNFQARFPAHVRTGYLRTVDSVGIVLLNSNFGRLSTDERRGQQEWYAGTLRALQGDDAVRAIVVCTHYSPYSNSTIVGSSEEVQGAFVPLYLETPKCRLFLSGHAHALEHFRRMGKDFLVLGGGGGLRQPLLTGADRAWEDLAPSPKPVFHYLVLERQGEALLVTVRGLQEGSPEVRDLYQLDVPADTSRGRAVPWRTAGPPVSGAR